MRTVVGLSLILSSQILWAQAPGAAREPGFGSTEMERRIAQQAFEKWALDPDASERAARAQSDIRAQEFYEKARRFVDLWRAFAASLNDKQTFNAKLAKQVSKAFHDLEKSDGWPVGSAK